MTEQEMIIILSTHIVGDISSSCNSMALLDHGNLVFNGTPDSLIEQARGHVFQATLTHLEFEKVKEEYNVISTIPSVDGWEVQVVAETMKDYPAVEVEPNLEHAYVYFMEHVLKEKL
jgi:ABC-type multidrug transport system ATPase subunit